MSRLTRIYTVCHSILIFDWDPTWNNGFDQIQRWKGLIRNSGMKGLMMKPYKAHNHLWIWLPVSTVKACTIHGSHFEPSRNSSFDNIPSRFCNNKKENHISLNMLGKIFSRRHIEIFLRQFAWKVKSCFVGKIRKISISAELAFLGIHPVITFHLDSVTIRKKILSRQHIEIFSYFAQKQVLTFHANCLKKKKQQQKNT